MFLGGWNDGTSGPLIPRMQKVYDVGFILVSLTFVLSCVGFISGSFLNMHLTDKLGFGRTIVLGALCQVIAFSIQAPALHFRCSFSRLSSTDSALPFKTPKRMHMWPACVIQSFIWECFMPAMAPALYLLLSSPPNLPRCITGLFTTLFLSAWPSRTLSS
ncbi:hypothetical protein B0H13DRAFT_1039198 [Mycena leptocephala]|nr:hypothetical protein B0H13DRAFT_1039198 [Mycena leptocephala]